MILSYRLGNITITISADFIINNDFAKSECIRGKENGEYSACHMNLGIVLKIYGEIESRTVGNGLSVRTSGSRNSLTTGFNHAVCSVPMVVEWT